MKNTKKPTSSHSKLEFSKTLLLQESILVWIMTISFIILAFICVCQGVFGELPWLTAMVGFPWGAYGISQAFYYRKSMAENTKDGIKYEALMSELNEGTAENPSFFG